jgi:hypothetical protein
MKFFCFRIEVDHCPLFLRGKHDVAAFGNSLKAVAGFCGANEVGAVHTAVLVPKEERGPNEAEQEVEEPPGASPGLRMRALLDRS